jgi:hypothetical protein
VPDRHQDVAQVGRALDLREPLAVRHTLDAAIIGPPLTD